MKIFSPKTACVACWYDGQILIAKRKETSTFDGYWNFPGGKIEPKELPAVGAVRELYEEAGVRIQESSITFVDGIMDDPTTTVCFIFEVGLLKEEAASVHNKELKKSHDWEWMSPKLALKKKLMPGMKEYLKRAVKRKPEFI